MQLGKGNSQIKEFNKQFEPNCNNSISACCLITQLKNNKNGKTNSLWFLAIYSTISLFVLYDNISEGKEFFNTILLFSVPIIFELWNMKKSNIILNIVLVIQKIFFSFIGGASLLGIMTDNSFILNEGFLVINTFGIGISIGIDIIFMVILIGTASLITNIFGAESPLDELCYKQYNQMINEGVSSIS